MKHSPRSQRARALLGNESLPRFSLVVSCDVPLCLRTLLVSFPRLPAGPVSLADARSSVRAGAAAVGCPDP